MNSTTATARPARGSLLVRLLHGPNFVRVIAPRHGLRPGITHRGDVVVAGNPWARLLRRCAQLLAVLVFGAAVGVFGAAAGACGGYAIGAVDSRLRG